MEKPLRTIDYASRRDDTHKLKNSSRTMFVFRYGLGLEAGLVGLLIVLDLVCPLNSINSDVTFHEIVVLIAGVLFIIGIVAGIAFSFGLAFAKDPGPRAPWLPFQIGLAWGCAAQIVFYVWNYWAQFKKDDDGVYFFFWAGALLLGSFLQGFIVSHFSQTKSPQVR